MLQETHLTETESLKLKRSWVGTVLFSPSTNKKNGVAILCHKKLKCKVLLQEKDMDGRWIVAKLLINSVPLTVFNIYDPTQPDYAFWPLITEKCTQFQDDLLVLGGDCNQVIDPFLDRKSTVPFYST